MKQVGRPAEKDSNGDRIAKCLVNCTIPTKLRDFLAEKNVNRSELFRQAALKLHDGEICPYCYSHEVEHVPKGWKCKDCSKWLKFNRCPLCDAIHNLTSGVRDVDGKIGCDLCPEYIATVEERKEIDVRFGNEL